MSGILMPSIKPSGLVFSILAGAIAASIVSVVLVLMIPGGSGSIDQRLPQTGPFGALISNIVPFVWVGLFAGLGASFWLVSSGRRSPGRAGWSVIALVILCMVYPVLASQVRQPIIAIMGNIVTVVCALLTAWACWPASRLASVFPALVAIWVSIASVGLLALMLGLPF